MTDCSVHVCVIRKVSGYTVEPERLHLRLPPGRLHYHGMLEAWLERSGLVWKQLDWDSYEVGVTKAQLEDYIEFSYGSDSTNAASGSPWPIEKLETVRQQLADLEDDAQYYLVSSCC